MYQLLVDRITLMIIILGGYVLSCQPPYNSNFQFFEIKHIVPRIIRKKDPSEMEIAKIQPPPSTGLSSILLSVRTQYSRRTRISKKYIKNS